MTHNIWHIYITWWSFQKNKSHWIVQIQSKMFLSIRHNWILPYIRVLYTCSCLVWCLPPTFLTRYYTSRNTLHQRYNSKSLQRTYTFYGVRQRLWRGSDENGSEKSQNCYEKSQNWGMWQRSLENPAAQRLETIL